MKNIRLDIAYDGSKFHGFQIQPNERTVQGELEAAIKRFTNEDITLTSAGRTDTGVHAEFHVSNFITKLDIPAISYMYKLRMYLPDDIVILNSSEVGMDFHSRYDAVSKRYRYIICNSKVFYPFYNDYKLHIKHELDIEKMGEAAKKLEGRHDFTAFMKVDEDKNPIRTIDKIEIYKKEDDVILEFEAQSFLYNQVRIMVGTLIDVGRGFRDPSYIDEIFEKKIERAAKTYGPQGLYLIDIKY